MSKDKTITREVKTLKVGSPEYNNRLIGKEEENPLESVRSCICFDSGDWGAEKRKAWIYGIVVGWNEDSYKEFQKTFRWSDKDCARNKRLHSKYKKMSESF